ncbi:ribonuclease HII [Methanolinea mesophila]|uniref:ribonuclease HII n=1 Tax=Methanolinea mesophila TaxID=547055 RepID=UPI001AE347E0|nr:ribonuclease HII [Methanolinea mesophila]
MKCVANGKVRRVLGIDEAGRGAVIGPLVICGIVCREDRTDDLVASGIRDSKCLKPDERTRVCLAARCHIDDMLYIVLTPQEIDASVRKHQLNVLEAKGMAAIINTLEPDLAIIDSVERVRPGVVEAGLGIRNFRHLIEALVQKEVPIVAENHADRNYPVVAAASVYAKVKRDELVASLYEKYGEDFGSGYPTRRTFQFLSEYFREHHHFPEDMRTNWKTRKKIEEYLTQHDLGEFIPR